MRRVLTSGCEYMQAQSGPGRVVDILEACGAFDPGSSPGRGVFLFPITDYSGEPMPVRPICISGELPILQPPPKAST